MSTATLDNSIIYIKPSESLTKYIRQIKRCDVPLGIKNVKSRKRLDVINRQPIDHTVLTNEEDKEFLKDLPMLEKQPVYEVKAVDVKNHDNLLNLEDLHWLRDYIIHQNEKNKEKIYFHELFQGSEVIVPKNREVERNPELELRCQQLRAQQENRRYNNMTKNVDCVRVNHPEDTIAFQMKQINTHLIAIAQFIMSVLAGFAFGFLGVELMIGKLDFGFRLLLGIMCALTIALAELYFLAKKLNEEMVYENPANASSNPKTLKVD